MLIILDESLIQSIDKNPSDSNLSAIAIDAIADSIRQGIHVLAAQVNTFDRLINFRQIFSARTSEILRRARSKLIFRTELLNSVQWQVRVIASDQEAKIIKLSPTKTEIQLPAQLISENTSLIGRPKFIAENANDAIFYKSLILEFAASAPEFSGNFSKLTLKFQITPGGGSTIAPLYALEKTQKYSFCLAVVDSDRRFPNGSYGETAKKLIAIDSPPNQPSWNTRSIVINSRTIENIFPKKTLIKTAESLDKNLGEIAKTVVQNHFKHSHWQYFSIKKGIKCHDLIQDGEEAKFWTEILNFKKCPNFTENACIKREACPTYALSPLGDGILAHACANSSPEIDFDDEFDKNLPEIIRPLFLEALSAFCGDEAVLGS